MGEEGKKYQPPLDHRVGDEEGARRRHVEPEVPPEARVEEEGSDVGRRRRDDQLGGDLREEEKATKRRLLARRRVLRCAGAGRATGRSG